MSHNACCFSNRILASLLALSLALPVSAELRRLAIDGFTEDWAGAAQVEEDPTGDGASIDLLGLSFANDEQNAVFRIELAQELVQQDPNGLQLLVDTDGDPQTGLAEEGLGVDFAWYFGSRSGVVYTPQGQGNAVSHIDVGLRILPTHGSADFELALSRTAEVAGQPLFPSNTLTAVLRVTAGDRLPDVGFFLASFGDDGELPPLPCPDFEREEATDLRLMAWNTLHGRLLLEPSAQPAYERMLAALRPDLIAFQEIWDPPASQVVQQLEQWFPEQEWQAVKLSSGNVLASALPITESWLIDAGYRNTAHLVDAQSTALGGPLLVFNIHLRCCGADNQRQYEADSIIHFLHEARNGEIQGIPQNTPFVLLGDFNLVGQRQQLLTLLEGDVQNEGLFGPDSPPDWDGSEITSLNSPHCGTADVFTWHDTGSSFSPGWLDYVLYSDSVIETARHGTVWTASMPEEALDEYSLLAGDAALASDHIPRFADFRPVTQTGLADPALPTDTELSVHPNPFNPSTRIRWVQRQEGLARLELYNLRGGLEQILREGPCAAGEHSLELHAGSLPAGLYLLALSSNGMRQVQRLLLLK